MEAKFVPYKKETYSEEEMVLRSAEHLDYMNKRRTVRDFSSKPIPTQVIQDIIMVAYALQKEP